MPNVKVLTIMAWPDQSRRPPQVLAQGMKILASWIKRQLKGQVGKWGHCAIYEVELQRLWPLDEKNRKAKIAKFAKEHGFDLSFYKPGLCAIFQKGSNGK